MFEPHPPAGHFEDGTTAGWEPADGYPCTVEADGTGVAHGGSWSLKVTSTEETGQTMAASTPQVFADSFLASPGDWLVNGWARSASAQVDHFEMRVGWFAADSSFLGESTLPREPAVLDVYVQFGPAVVTAPAGTAKFLIHAHASAPVDGGDFDAGQVVNMDDFTMELQEPPPPPPPVTSTGVILGVPVGAFTTPPP